MTLKLINGDGMEQTYGKVTLKYGDLIGPFANSFGKLASDEGVNSQVKLKLLRLRGILMEQHKTLEEKRSECLGKGDGITNEDKEALRMLAMSEFTVEFEQIDVLLLMNKLSVNDLDALRPILKGLK